MQPRKIISARGKRGIELLEHEPFDYPEIQPTIEMESKKISSKKPNFLHVKYSCLHQARQVRVKLWKLKSCIIEPIRGENVGSRRRFDQTMSHDDQTFLSMYSRSTLKTSMKSVRSLNVKHTIHKSGALYKFISPSFKLIDSLDINISESYFRSEQFNQTLFTPRLKQCQVNAKINVLTPDSEHQFQHFISKFQRCLDCKLLVADRDLPILLIRTSELTSLQRSLKQSDRDPTCPPLLNSVKAFEAASFEIESEFQRNLPMLNHLRDLQLFWKVNDHPFDDHELAKYPKLESLGLHLKEAPASLDRLALLPSLKQLSISTTDSEIPKGLFAHIPACLQNLQKLNLQFGYYTEFDAEELKGFLKKSQNLRTLGLESGIKGISSIFGQDLTLPIDQLSLVIRNEAKPFKEATKELANAIERHKGLKSLFISFSHCETSVHDTIFKAVSKLDSLIALKLNWDQMRELESNLFKELKNALNKNPHLKAFSLSMNDVPISSKDLSGLVDSLAKLKGLQKLFFDATLQKITPAAFQKFLELIESLKYLKSRNINVRGGTAEQQNQLNILLRNSSSLWEN